MFGYIRIYCHFDLRTFVSNILLHVSSTDSCHSGHDLIHPHNHPHRAIMWADALDAWGNTGHSRVASDWSRFGDPALSLVGTTTGYMVGCSCLVIAAIIARYDGSQWSKWVVKLSWFLFSGNRNAWPGLEWDLVRNFLSMRALTFLFSKFQKSVVASLKTTLVLLKLLLSLGLLVRTNSSSFRYHEPQMHVQREVCHFEACWKYFSPKEQKCINLREHKLVSGPKQCKLTCGSVGVWNGVFGIKEGLIPFVYLGSWNSNNSTRLV